MNKFIGTLAIMALCGACSGDYDSEQQTSSSDEELVRVFSLVPVKTADGAVASFEGSFDFVPAAENQQALQYCNGGVSCDWTLQNDAINPPTFICGDGSSVPCTDPTQGGNLVGRVNLTNNTTDNIRFPYLQMKNVTCKQSGTPVACSVIGLTLLDQDYGTLDINSLPLYGYPDVTASAGSNPDAGRIWNFRVEDANGTFSFAVDGFGEPVTNESELLNIDNDDDLFGAEFHAPRGNDCDDSTGTIVPASDCDSGSPVCCAEQAISGTLTSTCNGAGRTCIYTVPTWAASGTGMSLTCNNNATCDIAGQELTGASTINASCIRGNCVMDCTQDSGSPGDCTFSNCFFGDCDLTCDAVDRCAVENCGLGGDCSAFCTNSNVCGINTCPSILGIPLATCDDTPCDPSNTTCI
ncbi:MAG: hypothetical protein HC877_24395 [Thioploca sp.]|nr:hypothetical protein [Thioploca sp.]